MSKFQEIITEVSALRRGSIVREGFTFVSITHPGNIFDAIVVKCPDDVPCSSPQVQVELRGHTISDYVNFINLHGIEKALIIAHNLHFLTECHSLKYIKVIPPDDSGNGYDMSPLYQMPHIKGLYLATEYGKKCELRTTVDYSRVNGLESVSVNPCGHTNYEKIETLKTLGISNIKNGDMRGLISSQQLDTIQAIQCDFISLNGIEIAKELKCLYLFYNRKLTDISALKCFSSSLTALRIENCPRITDFSTIGLLGKILNYWSYPAPILCQA